MESIANAIRARVAAVIPMLIAMPAADVARKPSLDRWRKKEILAHLTIVIPLAALLLDPLSALHAADDAKLKPLERSPIGNRWGEVKPVKIQVEHVTVFRGREGEAYSHVPQLTSHRGKLYATWALGLRDEEAPGQRMVMSTSEDSGRTWSAPTTIAPSRHGKSFLSNVSSCGLRILPDGRFVAYSAEWEWEPDAYHPDGSRRNHPICDPAMGHEERMWKTCQSRTEARVSTDNGRTWSEPAVVAPKQGGYFGPVKMRSGRLILPGNFGACYFTDDPAGLTRWERAGIPGIPGSHEDSFFHTFEARQALVGGKRGFVLYHSINPFNLFNLEVESASMAIAVVVALVAGLVIHRPFCQFVCPFGLVSWMAERFSVARVQINPKRCNRCGACSRACPLDAAKHRVAGKLLAADCYSCARCLNVCPHDAITYGFAVGRAVHGNDTAGKS